MWAWSNTGVPQFGQWMLRAQTYVTGSTMLRTQCFFFPGWNRYPQKKITQKIELVTWHWASNISIYVFVPYIIADVTGSMWRYWLNFFSDFFFVWKKVEPVRWHWASTMPWASTLSLSQYDDTEPVRWHWQHGAAYIFSWAIRNERKWFILPPPKFPLTTIFLIPLKWLYKDSWKLSQ